ncbi:MAG: peptidoglycan-binding protein, partial [Actinobacteria bacterium]|nr:peptidoglycan-binding protein [Actinomycetota bacterium]
GNKYAYTVAHAQAFKDHGAWHPMTNGVVNSGIRRGDIIFFDWSGGTSIGAIDHVGLVTGVSGSTVLTIEGNFDNRCGRFARTASVIAGFGRPHYVAAPNPTPTPTPTPGSKYEPFPGAGFFYDGHRSPVIAAMHDRLVAVGCNRYQSSSNKDVWGSGDVASYSAWQKKCGFSGSDANGTPGKTTWDLLRVPNV